MFFFKRWILHREAETVYPLLIFKVPQWIKIVDFIEETPSGEIKRE